MSQIDGHTIGLGEANNKTIQSYTTISCYPGLAHFPSIPHDCPPFRSSGRHTTGCPSQPPHA